jgi:hypothetical protein
LRQRIERRAAAVEDIVAVYEALTATGAHVVVAGDSAGGGRAAGLQLPHAVALLSPWTDLRLQDPCIVELADDDVLLNAHVRVAALPRTQARPTSSTEDLIGILAAMLGEPNGVTAGVRLDAAAASTTPQVPQPGRSHMTEDGPRSVVESEPHTKPQLTGP